MPALVDAAAVDLVEVLRVRTEGWAYWGSWATIPGETVGVSTGSEVEELLRLLSELPDGEQMRCFTPAYGLRLFAGTQVLAETAICFRCNKAVTNVGGKQGWFKFDAQSVVAQRLLAALTSYDAHPPATA
jgi:hypothetical protein